MLAHAAAKSCPRLGREFRQPSGLWAEGTQFTCFTSTQVQILTYDLWEEEVEMFFENGDARAAEGGGEREVQGECEGGWLAREPQVRVHTLTYADVC
jgi:hypothetical protein